MKDECKKQRIDSEDNHGPWRSTTTTEYQNFWAMMRKQDHPVTQDQLEDMLYQTWKSCKVMKNSVWLTEHQRSYCEQIEILCKKAMWEAL